MYLNYYAYNQLKSLYNIVIVTWVIDYYGIELVHLILGLPYLNDTRVSHQEDNYIYTIHNK